MNEQSSPLIAKPSRRLSNQGLKGRKVYVDARLDKLILEK
jgi:hypothetical protein